MHLGTGAGAQGGLASGRASAHVRSGGNTEIAEEPAPLVSAVVFYSLLTRTATALLWSWTLSTHGMHAMLQVMYELVCATLSSAGMRMAAIDMLRPDAPKYRIRRCTRRRDTGCANHASKRPGQRQVLRRAHVQRMCPAQVLAAGHAGEQHGGARLQGRPPPVAPRGGAPRLERCAPLSTHLPPKN
jgi:hypothetical protein